MFSLHSVRWSNDCVQARSDGVPLGQGLVWADNLTAAKVN